jgi:hypothetical protein
MFPRKSEEAVGLELKKVGSQETGNGECGRETKARA